MIKFSVIIPLYNKEKEIKNTIQSVLNQTYKADEIIIVDDGSTDGSVAVIQKYFREQVSMIKQKNCGVSHARNRGIQEAQNEYLCFLDADDLWEDNFLEEINNLIVDFPDAIVYSTSHKMINENGNIIQPKVFLPLDFRGYIKNFIQLFTNNYGIINSSSVCIRKPANPLFPVNEKKGEDICLWIELSLKGKFAFVNKPLSIYKLDASNRSGDIHKEPIIPCQLKWLYKNNNIITSDIKNFIYSNIFITCYGMVLNNNKQNVKAIVSYMKQHHDLYYIFLIPSLFLPSFILQVAKKIRRKLR